jgi:hypothetical protein
MLNKTKCYIHGKVSYLSFSTILNNFTVTWCRPLYISGRKSLDTMYKGEPTNPLLLAPPGLRGRLEQGLPGGQKPLDVKSSAPTTRPRRPCLQRSFHTLSNATLHNNFFYRNSIFGDYGPSLSVYFVCFESFVFWCVAC